MDGPVSNKKQQQDFEKYLLEYTLQKQKLRIENCIFRNCEFAIAQYLSWLWNFIILEMDFVLKVAEHSFQEPVPNSP